MGAKAQRRKARSKQQSLRSANMVRPDVHAQHLMSSIASLDNLVENFRGTPDPIEAIGEEFDAALRQFVNDLKDFEPHRLVEAARLVCLPWSVPGQIAVEPEATAAHVELLALVALSTNPGRNPQTFPDTPFQQLSEFVNSVSARLNSILQLALVRSILQADRTDPLALIGLFVRGTQVYIRNTTYPFMAERTLRQLFNDNLPVRESLVSELGFDVNDALAVLNACHDVQQAQLNERMIDFGTVAESAIQSNAPSMTTEEKAKATALLASLFEPDFVKSTVGIADLVARSGVAESTVGAVLKQFRVDLSGFTPSAVVDSFLAGDNPMRSRPLLMAVGGRVMLAHNALNADAIKENLESLLKDLPTWDTYAKHRGEVLESRTHTALAHVFPNAIHRDGFEYFVPANESELATKDVAKYSKKVECDHLVIIDDLAIIVEDKAVALSALSKGGKATRLRSDLVGIVSKAAIQSGRLRDAIQRDGGLRLHGEGWVDLSHLREIHTIAVSLDDLTSISTATSELVRAGLLDATNIPWTVSLHDLELIAKISGQPAEFLLFLRRRLRPDVTAMYSAPDELDLYLYFLEAGLWVETDPDEIRSTFAWMPEPSVSERRRFAKQVPAYITSRTDALDAWYYSGGMTGGASAPKPRMVSSPLQSTIDEIQERQGFGWLTICATLLESATGIQRKMARYPENLLRAPRADGIGRSLAVPMIGTVNASQSWLIVWSTRPVGRDPNSDDQSWAEYVRLKKFQLGIPRGAVLVYDEVLKNLVSIIYDGEVGELPPELVGKLSSLRPASELMKPDTANAGRSRSKRGRKGRKG